MRERNIIDDKIAEILTTKKLFEKTFTIETMGIIREVFLSEINK